MFTTKVNPNPRVGKTTRTRKSANAVGEKTGKQRSKCAQDRNLKPTKNEPFFRSNTVPDVKFEFSNPDKNDDQLWFTNFLKSFELSLDLKSGKKKLWDTLCLFLQKRDVEIKDDESLMDFIKRCSQMGAHHYYLPKKELVEIEYLFDATEGVCTIDLHDLDLIKNNDWKMGMVLRQLFLHTINHYSFLYEEFNSFIDYEVQEAKESVEYYASDPELKRTDRLQELMFLEDNRSIERFLKIAFSSSPEQSNKRSKILAKLCYSGYFDQIGISEEVSTLLYENVNRDYIIYSDMVDMKMKINSHVNMDEDERAVEFENLFMIVKQRSVDEYHPYCAMLDENWGNAGACQYYNGKGDTVSFKGNKGMFNIHQAINSIESKISIYLKKVEKL